MAYTKDDTLRNFNFPDKSNIKVIGQGQGSVSGKFVPPKEREPKKPVKLGKEGVAANGKAREQATGNSTADKPALMTVTPEAKPTGPFNPDNSTNNYMRASKESANKFVNFFTDRSEGRDMAEGYALRQREAMKDTPLGRGEAKSIISSVKPEGYNTGLIPENETSSVTPEGTKAGMTPGSKIREYIGESGERAFTNVGEGIKASGEPSKLMYGNIDITNMTPEERLKTKLDSMARATEMYRQAREVANPGITTRGQGGRMSPDRGMSNYERKEMLAEYKKEINSVMNDMRSGNLTVGGGRNAITALQDYYTQALGLSPRNEEAGKDYRAGVASDTDIEVARILDQGKTAREGQDQKPQYGTYGTENEGDVITKITPEGVKFALNPKQVVDREKFVARLTKASAKDEEAILKEWAAIYPNLPDPRDPRY